MVLAMRLVALCVVRLYKVECLAWMPPSPPPSSLLLYTMLNLPFRMICTLEFAFALLSIRKINSLNRCICMCNVHVPVIHIRCTSHQSLINRGLIYIIRYRLSNFFEPLSWIFEITHWVCNVDIITMTLSENRSSMINQKQTMAKKTKQFSLALSVYYFFFYCKMETQDDDSWYDARKFIERVYTKKKKPDNRMIESLMMSVKHFRMALVYNFSTIGLTFYIIRTE